MRPLLVSIILGVVLLLFCSGCTITRIVPVREASHSQRDSTHTALRADSIYLHDSIYIHHQGDTVYRERYLTKYKERLQMDTIYLHRVDSFYREVAVKVDKPPSRLSRIIHTWGWISLTASLLILVYIIRKTILRWF